MNRNKKFIPRFSGKGPNGRRLCVWCGVEVPEGRRNWCGQACVEAMTIEHWPQAWAKAVIKRDRGICQVCGFDAGLLDRIEKRLWERTYPHQPYTINYAREHAESMAAKQTITHQLRVLGYDTGRSLVEADHITPVCEGGSNALSNGRTLCQLCHRDETAKLAARRKWDRRARRNGLLFAMRE